ncbi:hypothetical protein P3L10_003598 [Capsicum annuum]
MQFLHTGIVSGIFSNQLKITDVLLDQNFHLRISKYNLPLLTENKKMDSGPSSNGSKGSNELRCSSSPGLNISWVLKLLER